MQVEDSVDPRAIYNQAMHKSLAGTKIPLYMMAKYLRELGYSGYISVHDPRQTRGHAPGS